MHKWNSSDSNIYQDPSDKRKKRLFKKVYHVMDRGFEYQEINSDGMSIGGRLMTLPVESQNESTLSKETSQYDDSTTMKIPATKKVEASAQFPLEIVAERDELGSVVSSPSPAG